MLTQCITHTHTHTHKQFCPTRLVVEEVEDVDVEETHREFVTVELAVTVNVW